MACCLTGHTQGSSVNGDVIARAAGVEQKWASSGQAGVWEQNGDLTEGRLPPLGTIGKPCVEAPAFHSEPCPTGTSVLPTTAQQVWEQRPQLLRFLSQERRREPGRACGREQAGRGGVGRSWACSPRTAWQPGHLSGTLLFCFWPCCCQWGTVEEGGSGVGSKALRLRSSGSSSAGPWSSQGSVNNLSARL